MIKLIFLLLALSAAIVSCDKSENENEEAKNDLKSADYIGTLTIDASSGSFDTDSTKVSFNTTDKSDSATITMYQVKFSPKMPVSLDVTVPGITVVKTQKGAIITCDSIVPLAMGGEYPKYTVKDFEGEIVDDQLTFSLKFGSTPTSFSGHIQMQ